VITILAGMILGATVIAADRLADRIVERRRSRQRRAAFARWLEINELRARLWSVGRDLR
jgi:hypothetical protein